MELGEETVRSVHVPFYVPVLEMNRVAAMAAVFVPVFVCPESWGEGGSPELLVGSFCFPECTGVLSVFSQKAK